MATCPVAPCSAVAEPRIAPAVEVEVDSARLRLEGIGVHLCARGHATVVDDDVAARIRAAFDHQLVVAQRRRLRRSDACGSCGEPLTLPGRATEVPVPLATPLGVITPTLCTTFVRCPACGIDQLPHAVTTRLPRLIDAALVQVAQPTDPPS